MYEGGEGETVIKVTMASFLYGEYAAACVLVTFCMMLGKVSILQLIIMALLEVRINQPQTQPEAGGFQLAEAVSFINY